MVSQPGIVGVIANPAGTIALSNSARNSDRSNRGRPIHSRVSYEWDVSNVTVFGMFDADASTCAECPSTNSLTT